MKLLRMVRNETAQTLIMFFHHETEYMISSSVKPFTLLYNPTQKQFKVKASGVLGTEVLLTSVKKNLATETFYVTIFIFFKKENRFLGVYIYRRISDQV